MKTTLAALTLSAAALSAAMLQAQAPTGGRPLATTLTGAAEVPGPGDADGTGSFKARINPGTGQLCYTLTAANIETATAAHIHRGGNTVAGPVVFGLETPTTGRVQTCGFVSKELAKELVQNAAGFYVNVHNAPHPAGAVRGQLSN